MRTPPAALLLLVALSGCAAADAEPRAFWNLDGPVDQSSTSIEIAVQRADCADGETGELLDPEVSYEADRIVIRARVAPNGLDGADCQENDRVSQTVELSEPVGQRELVDALCLSKPEARSHLGLPTAEREAQE